MNGPPRPLRRPVVGKEVALGTHHVSRAEIIDFARDWDPQWFHLDAEAARLGRFGDVIGSGIHAIAVYQRLAVAAAYLEWDLVAGRGFRDVRFLAPLRPDTDVTGRLRVVSIEPAGRSETIVVNGDLVEVGLAPRPILSITMDVALGPGGSDHGDPVRSGR